MKGQGRRRVRDLEALCEGHRGPGGDKEEGGRERKGSTVAVGWDRGLRLGGVESAEAVATCVL